jgi:hypothetical protein
MAVGVLTIVAFSSVLLAAPQQSAPQDTRNATTTARAVRAEQAPEVDGRASDAVWATAPKTADFRQFEPRIDADPTFRTEFQVAYDVSNLYVFVRMYDPRPDSIMHALTRRDVRGPSDQIKLLIDSYGDKRSGFSFAVNPDGVKRDFALYNDGQEDASWNGVWDVATVTDSLGWTAEFRIPLSQLRYAGADEHTFGFGVWRDIERLKERTSWPLYETTRSGLSSQLGELAGLTGITSARSVEVTPYTVTKNVRQALPNNRFERQQKFTVGGDLKLGITPNVTLDATVNPDFGQVEADPAVVNLTAFESFFPERRPFFVEGTGVYQFQLNCYIVVDCSTNEGLFYSRRIGRSPQLRNDYGDATTATATPIAIATKLTGRTRSGLSFGVLDAVTQHVEGANDMTVEPRTNYAVIRAQQDLRGGEAGVSLIATAVNRALDDVTSPMLHSSAYAAGATFRNRFHNQQYEVAGQLTVSRVAGSADAIRRTKANGVHYFQQPDDELAFDSAATSLGGYAAQLKFGKYGGGITRFESSIVRQSAGFDVNDLGYLRRADLVDWSTWAALSFREARGIYRWAQFNANHWETWNTSGKRLENAFNVNGHMGLRNNWDVHLGGTLGRVTPSYCDRCTRGGPLVRSSRSFAPWGGVNTDARRTVQASMWANLWFGDDGRTRGSSLSPSIGLRLSTSLQANIGTGFNRDRSNTQWFGNYTDDDGITHYSFARLDQRTVSMSLRVNYTATPDLTFEFFGQPFVSKGRYSDIRELSATPLADDYEQRYQPYTPPPNSRAREFNVSEVKTNAVMRWEFRPGSTLFLVWAHGRQNDERPYSDRSWMYDYRDLFDLRPDNTLLVKIAYWLNR